MVKTIRVILIVLVLALAAGCAAPAAAPAAAVEKQAVALKLPFMPNVQFAPVYVALEKGFFSQQGLEVSLEYGPENDAVALIGANQAKFAVVSGEQVLLGRAQGLPVVYITAWYQQYPVGIAALESSGIKTLQDLKSRKVGTPVVYGASYIGLRALLNAGGLQEKDIDLRTISYTQVESLMTNQVDAVVIYTANEPLQLAAQGHTPVVLPVADYTRLVSNGLLTSQKVLDEEPDLAKRMSAALLQGIDYTMQHSDEAFEISKKYVENLDQDASGVQKQVLEASIELWKADRLGASDPQAWQNMQDILLQMGLLSKPLDDLAAAYSNAYLPEQ